MRYAITFEPPVEVGNAFEKDPKAGELLARLLEPAKPEAVYFSCSRRFVIVIANAESHEELARLIIPIWHTMKVYPQVEPILNLEEFQAAFPKYQQLVKDL